MSVDLSGLITREDKAQAQHDAKCAAVRRERDRMLEAAAGRRDRYRDEIELGIDPTEPLEPLLEYIQNLRDVPQQEGFPDNVEWPIVPVDE